MAGAYKLHLARGDLGTKCYSFFGLHQLEKDRWFSNRCGSKLWTSEY